MLCQNSKTNVLYLVVTTLTNDITFLIQSKKFEINDQIKEIFSEFDFNDDNAGGFDMFPGFKNKVYGYCDKEKIILGSSCQIIRY